LKAVGEQEIDIGIIPYKGNPGVSGLLIGAAGAKSGNGHHKWQQDVLDSLHFEKTFYHRCNFSS
jgi:hypothetical protein